MSLPKFYETEAINAKKYQSETILLELKLQEPFKFQAGQFILAYVNIDKKEENRAFSICSNPSQKTIKLLIKKYNKGKVSPALYNLKPGDNLKIRGPFGVFTVNQPEKEEIFFIASGTGIAPLISMIYEILEKNPKKKITLIYGYREEENCFFKEELENLEKNFENFKIHHCSTKPPKSWSHLKGRVTEHILKIIKNNENKETYICGPNQMINDCLNLLIKELNFDKSQIHIERWGTK